MGYSLSFSQAGVGSVSFTPENDTNITGAAVSGQAIVTSDPTATYASVVTTPTFSGIDHQTLLLLAGLPGGKMSIPLEGGRKYFVTFKAAGVVNLFFDA